MNATTTKTFFDIVSIYSDRILIGIISQNLNLISYKMRSSASGTEVNHSVSITIDTEIDKLSNSKYWYFNISSKKDHKMLSNGDLSIVKVLKENGKTFAILFNGISTLKVEIKEYEIYDYRCNHKPAENVGNTIKDMSYLKQFCSKNDHSPINSVWSFDRGIFATDGCHGMIQWCLPILEKFQDWSISGRDLDAITKLLKLDSSPVFSYVNYFNNDNEEVTETKLKISTKHKLSMEIDFIPCYSRPALETMIREDLKNRETKLSLNDLRNLKKELTFFKKNNKDDLIRLDIFPDQIIISDKTLLLSRSIKLENNNVNTCVLTFKVDYILNVINFLSDKNYDFTYLKWKHSKVVLDPVLITSYFNGNHQSTGILMPVQIRDNSYYELSYDDYKRHWRESNI